MATPEKAPSKGKLWKDCEVESMLRRLHHAGAGPRVMTSTHMETVSVFEEVVRGMQSEGYHRSAAQARSKFKREKSDFFLVMQRNNGKPPPGERPPRYRLLKRLWIQADCPNWSYRYPGRSARTPRRNTGTSEQEIIDSEDDQDDSEMTETNTAEKECLLEDRAESYLQSSQSCEGTSAGEQQSRGDQNLVEEPAPSTSGSDGGHAQQVDRSQCGSDQAAVLDERFQRLETRMLAAEQTCRAVVEQNNMLRRDFDNQATLLRLHQKGILQLLKMIRHDRICLGIETPRGEEPVLPEKESDN